ncbi:MAG: GtrA family protein [Patescibacteria group bacterium]|nr:GtrA family protein [Patescibacteria group bacterium]
MSLINSLYLRFGRFLQNKHARIFNVCEKRKSVVKFFISGSLASVVDLLALYLFHGVFRWEIVLSTSLAFLFSFMVSFSLQKFWTFRDYSNKRLPHQLVLYIGAAFISLNLNALAMHVLVNNWQIWYLLSQIVVNLFLGVINFFTYKYIVFPKKLNEDKN